MSRNTRIALASVAAVAVTALVLLLLFGTSLDDLRPAAPADRAAARPDAVAQPGSVPGAEGPAIPAAAPPEEAEDEPEEGTPPALAGTVYGERGPLPGATVNAYPFAMVKDLIHKYESLSVSGLGDIPALLAQVRQDILGLKSRGFAATTNAEGRYAYAYLAPGEYTFLVLGPGHIFKAGDTALIRKDVPCEQDFALSAGEPIAGKVVNPRGEAVAGASVLALYQTQGFGGLGKLIRKGLAFLNGEFLKGPFEGRTGADGRFRIDTLPPGVYELDVVARSYAEARIPDVATGTGELIIQLGDGGTIRGTAVDGEKPVVNVTVRLVANEDKFQLPIPVPGANEALESVRHLLDEEDRSVLTDATGTFVWEHLRPGAYEVCLEAPGYLRCTRDVAVGDGQIVDLGNIALDRGNVLRGRVVTSRKEPVAGAVVAALPDSGNQMQIIMSAIGYATGRTRTVTDANGEFALSGLAQSAATFKVAASHQRFGVGTAEGVRPDGEPVEIMLDEPWTLAGRVVRASDKQPVAGAEVFGGGAETRTDEEGVFVLTPVVPDANPMLFSRVVQQGVEGGRRRQEAVQRAADRARIELPRMARGEPSVRVFARAEGLSPRERFLTEKDLEREIVLELRDEIRVEGIVRSPEGRPKAGVFVRLVPGQLPPVGGMDMITLGLALSNAEGFFSFGQLRGPAQLRVAASFPGYATVQSEPFWIGRDAPPPFVELQLEPGGAITGFVVNARDRTPLARIKLRLHPAQERSEAARVGVFLSMFGIPEAGEVAYSNIEGRFVYHDVTPGAYVVTASAGAGITRSAKVEVRPNEAAEATIELEVGGTINGVVLDAAGAPVSFASVRLLDAGNVSLASLQKAMGGSVARQSTDVAGVFEFAQVRHGTYSLIAEKQGYAPREIGDVRVDDDPVRVVLQAEGSIAGGVRRAGTGEIVTAFQVRIDKAEKGWNSPLKSPRGIDDPDGLFWYEGLEAGSYLVEVRARGAAPATVPVTVESGRQAVVEVLLEAACSVAGKVMLEDGETPVAGARVALVAAKSQGASTAAEAFGGYIEGRMNEIATSTNGQGDFTLNNLPPGELELEATHNAYRPSRAAIVVTAGEQGTCTIVMHSGFSLSGTVLGFEGAPEAERAILIEGPDNIQKVAMSRRDGSFSFNGLKAGKYRLWCPTPDLSRELPPRTVEIAEDCSDVVITLPPPADRVAPGELPADVPAVPEVPEDLKDRIDPAKMQPGIR